MNVLLIGSGGREHALIKKLHQSPQQKKIFVIPGSDAFSDMATCLPLSWRDFDEVGKVCDQNQIDLVIIGPEEPLVEGLSDYLRKKNINVVGPSQQAAQLEGSKIFAKEFMLRAQIPTARHFVVQSVDDLKEKNSFFRAPYVLKADGLAAGKGVFICNTLDELLSAGRDLFEKQILGNAGKKALLEEFSPGWELSYLLLTNGTEWSTLPLAQDHKRLLDQDKGPNTGGMGTIAPMDIPISLRSEIENNIVRPIINQLNKEQFIYRGVLFIGVMVTPQGPSVLEFNVRFGDPETQVILPLIKNDLIDVLTPLSRGQMPTLELNNDYACCVVLAAPGYPYQPQKNVLIEGEIVNSFNLNSYFLHAGTTLNLENKWVTAGGRVLNAIGVGKTREEARAKAYQQASLAKWPQQIKRNDIGINESKN